MNPVSFIVLAQASQPAGPAGWQQMIANFFPFIFLFVILYFLWIRPEQKRSRTHREMLLRLKTGDHVVTSGGIHGTVTGVKDQTIMVKVADKVEVEMERAAIGRVQAQTSEREGK